MPNNVLMRLTPLPPPASTAFAISTISVTFGESFTITGLSVTLRTALVTCSTTFGSTPNAMPSLSTFGHDTLTSRPAIPSTDSVSAIQANSSTVPADIFASNGTSYFLSSGKISVTKCSAPGFSRPMQFNTPDGVSAIRGPGLP